MTLSRTSLIKLLNQKLLSKMYLEKEKKFRHYVKRYRPLKDVQGRQRRLLVSNIHADATEDDLEVSTCTN